MNLDVILISVITAISVVFVEKIIGFYFFKTESKIKQKQEYDSKYLDQGRSMHYEMIKLTKLSKNLIRDILQSKSNNISHQALIDLHESSRLFSINLTTYEMFVSHDLYEKLHVYKHLVEDCVVLIDGLNSPQRIASGELDFINKLMKEQLTAKFEEINGRFDFLVKEMIKASRSIDLPTPDEPSHVQT